MTQDGYTGATICSSSVTFYHLSDSCRWIACDRLVFWRLLSAFCIIMHTTNDLWALGSWHIPSLWCVTRLYSRSAAAEEAVVERFAGLSLRVARAQGRLQTYSLQGVVWKVLNDTDRECLATLAADGGKWDS